MTNHMSSTKPRGKAARQSTTVRPPDPAWEACAWLDPVWAERLSELTREADQPSGVDPKLMALVALAVDAAPQSLYPQGVRRHIRRALGTGASLEEIAAVLRYVSLLGQHSLKLGTQILMEELAAHQHHTPTRHHDERSS